MKNFRMKTLLMIGFILFFTACSSDDDSPSLPLGDYENGIFILNEGTFGQGTGSLSFIGENNQIQNNQYQEVNGEMLGDVAQSITLYENQIFMVINASNRLVIANRYTLENVATLDNIDQLRNPRYLAVANNKAYVTNWGDGSVATDDFVTVIDLADNSIETTISVPEGPERIVAHNNLLYVLHQGGFNQNNQVSVINPTNNTVVSRTVGDVPNSYQIVNNELYILCGGGFFFDSNNNFAVTPTTEGSIWRANNTNFEQFMDLANVVDGLQNAGELNYANDNFYFQLKNSSNVDDIGVYRTATNQLDAEKIIDQTFYDLYAIDNQLYALNAADFTSAGTAVVYDSNGNQINSYTTGIIPSFVIKN